MKYPGFESFQKEKQKPLLMRTEIRTPAIKQKVTLKL